MNYIQQIAGEEKPFLPKSRATYERIGKVVCEYGVRVQDCMEFCDSLVLSLEIPRENFDAVKRVLKCSFTDQEVAKGMR
jgi:hypothetical protein